MSKTASLEIQQHRATYIGELGATAVHRHGALALVIGLSGRIRLNFEHGATLDCRSALIDAGVRHSLDPQGERIVTIYAEIDSPITQALRSYYLKDHPFAIDVIEPNVFLFRNKQRIVDCDLPALFGQKGFDYLLPVDPRVERCIELLKAPSNFTASQGAIAQQVNLSTSRLNHLFKQMTGISYRHYRLWTQLAYFMRDVKGTSNISMSAQNSGFFDAAHLTNSYRKFFGIAPWALIKDLNYFEVN